MSNLVHYSYWLWESALSEQFCTAVLNEVDWATAKQATVTSENVVANPDTRVTDIVWQPPIQPLGCIARAYMDMANQSANWNYVTTSQENVQLSRYRSTNKGHYDWHMDADAPIDGIQRKLSCVILLSDASDIEGGELLIKDLDHPNLLTKRGSIIVFPSFVDHKVTPVTKGVRYTAVSWISGPSFK